MSVYAKLLAVQTSLKAPKGQFNSFGKYKYRSCEDILEAVKPHLKEVGLVLTLTDDLLMIGNRYYVKATATVTDIQDGAQISVNAFAREEDSKKGMDGSQVTGASSSYARKYALNGLFDIDDTKDSDATNNGSNGNNPGTPPQNPQNPNNPNQGLDKAALRKQLIARLDAMGIDKNAYSAANGLDRNTPAEVYQRLLKELDRA